MKKELEIISNNIALLWDLITNQEYEDILEVEDTYQRLLKNYSDLIEVYDKLATTKEEQKKFKKLEEKIDIEFAQKKKYITTKEFAEIYNMSSKIQYNRRGRLHNPLPYHQGVKDGKIVYVVEEVEKWFDNEHK